MTQQAKKILVLGATGKQGGAVIHNLLEHGYKQLHALVRNDDDNAKTLAAQGVTLVTGDLNDAESLKRAMQGMYGAFCALPLTDDAGLEVRWGKAVADAAKQANVQHFVYSSVGGADRSQGVPHFQTKYTIENYIRELDIPASIVRPTSFMENFRAYQKPLLKDGVQIFRTALHPDTHWQLIAVNDVGMIVVDMFDKPDEAIGKTIEIAGDELTGPEIAATYQKITGQPARFEEQPIEEIRAFSDGLARMFTWINEHGYKADIPALHRKFPDLMRFEAWLRANNPL